jgi:hypothetical protein
VKFFGIKPLIVSLFLILTATGFLAGMAEAIPLFARNYKISCTTCHVGFPKLNSFGEAFAGNGYRFSEDDLAEQNIETGDDKLQLLNHLPLHNKNIIQRSSHKKYFLLFLFSFR